MIDENQNYSLNRILYGKSKQINFYFYIDLHIFFTILILTFCLNIYIFNNVNNVMVSLYFSRLRKYVPKLQKLFLHWNLTFLANKHLYNLSMKQSYISRPSVSPNRGTYNLARGLVSVSDSENSKLHPKKNIYNLHLSTIFILCILASHLIS